MNANVESNRSRDIRDRKPVALVTGGAQRIGRAIVESLAADGHPVAIHCNRSTAEAERLAADLRAAGREAMVVQGDLADLDGVGAIVRRAEAELGPVALLVNSASRFEEDAMDHLAPGEMLQHFSINLAAPCLLAAEMARRLPERVSGLVVNIVDQRVLKPAPQFFSYSLSKSGLWWTTQTMAQALAPRIRVVALGPGPTLPSARQSREEFERQAAATLLGRAPDLADFGRTIRWVLETPSITGQLITLDGGQHLAWQTADIYGIIE